MAATLETYVHPVDIGQPNPEGWLLVDVRTPGEFRGLSIDGSLNAPLGGLTQQVPAIQRRAAGKKVALVCRTGQRAEKAKEILEAAHLSDLYILDGGVVAWRSEGLPLLRGKEGMSIERQVRIAAGLLVLVGVILGLTVHRGFLGISGFVGAGLTFAGLTDTCAMGMMLAKMPWNRASVACDDL